MPEALDARRWSLPVPDGTRSAVAAVKTLEQIQVDVVDVTVTTPSLDDVFLALTGRTHPDAGADSNPAETDPADASEKEHAHAG